MLTKKKQVSQETLIKTLIQRKQPSIKQGLPVERRALITVAFISTILISTLAGTQFVNFATANPNPFPFGEGVPPDTSTKPPTITISSTIVNGNNITINFEASVGESTTAFSTRIRTVYYNSDWNQNRTYPYQIYDPLQDRAECSLCELNIPEGKHAITVYALEEGTYIRGATMHAFNITSFSSVNFTINTLPPNVSVLRMENKTYVTSDVPLSFTVDEAVSQIKYSLDGQDNVTIAGNTTLAGLPVGVHNVTVYAWDEAENVGSSETVYFTIAEPEPEPFPTTLVIVPIALVALIGMGLLAYFKKRKR
jgi:hypothetical protein